MAAVCASEDSLVYCADSLLNVEIDNDSVFGTDQAQVPCTSSVAFPSGSPLGLLGGPQGGLGGGPQGYVDHSGPNGVEAQSATKGVRIEEYMSNLVDEDKDSNLSTDVSSEDVKSLGDSECGTPVPAELPRAYTIFDWDDTLFPTTWIQMNGLMTAAPTREQCGDLARLSTLVMATLRIALKANGKVVVVTNGDAGWVELSMRHFMPAIEPLLNQNDIDIISARSLQEPTGVSCPFEWKRLTFAQLLEDYYMTDEERNIVCLGDSMHEHHAISQVTQEMYHCSCKSIKFAVRPDVDQLCKQHERLATCFEAVVSQGGKQHFEL